MFPLTAVIFDWLWPKSFIVKYITFSLSDHRAVIHLKEKKLANAWGHVRGRLGNDQGFHKLFTYGCPDREREFEKRKDNKLLKRLYNIYS